jgi:hypothetical protein
VRSDPLDDGIADTLVSVAHVYFFDGTTRTWNVVIGSRSASMLIAAAGFCEMSIRIVNNGAGVPLSAERVNSTQMLQSAHWSLDPASFAADGGSATNSRSTEWRERWTLPPLR